jgi:hypothetical protein
MASLTSVNHIIGVQYFQGIHDLSDDTLDMGDTQSLAWSTLLEAPHVRA